MAIAAINLLSATQDIATDGVAVRLLGPGERGLANGIQTGAYRLGMIAGGGGLLWVFAQTGWRTLLLTLGGLILLCTIPVLLFMPDEAAQRPAQPRAHRWSSPGLATAWLVRLRRPGVLALIGLLAAYKFGNAMASSLAGPFLHDSGLSLSQIALVSGALSSTGALLGSAVGAWLAVRFGRRRALIMGGIGQTAAVGLYVAAALGSGGIALVVTANLTEHVVGGAATVALFTLMMDASDRDYAGADYTLLACAVVAAQGMAGFAAGAAGDLLGYAPTFAVATVLSALGLLIFVRGLDAGRGPASLTTWRTPAAPSLA